EERVRDEGPSPRVVVPAVRRREGVDQPVPQAQVGKAQKRDDGTDCHPEAIALRPQVVEREGDGHQQGEDADAARGEGGRRRDEYAAPTLPGASLRRQAARG